MKTQSPHVNHKEDEVVGATNMNAMEHEVPLVENIVGTNLDSV